MSGRDMDGDMGREVPHLRPAPARAAAAAGAMRSVLRGIGLLRHSRLAMIGLVLVSFWILLAIFAPWIAPYRATQSFVPLQPPMTTLEGIGTFWLGTDSLGRDVLSRVIHGTRVVLFYAPVATAAAYIIGIALGLLAGYRRGWIDDVLSRISDMILSFPVIVLYVVIITTFGPSGLNVILAVIFASTPGIMRIVRGLTLDLRNRDYVAAAQIRGESAWYVMLVEILPNARGPLIVDACLRLGYTIITIGTLGFLGLGLPPASPDWGTMIKDGRTFAMFAPHLVIAPAVAISSLVLGFNLLADGLRQLSLKD